jgi:DNA repair protein SbcC/Rad50
VQLRRLDVANIRSFESGRLDLGPGTTLLVGDVGAGKSSLLYAVEMALFGVAEVDATYLIRHGTTHAEVAVTLVEDDHTYVVRRRFRKVRRRGRETYEPEKLTFAEDGRPTAYSATEIRQRVIELLGFPDNPNPHAHSDLWRWAIYVPQERMREILAADPEERLETVRKALGVERYRTAAENAQVLSADLRLSARRRREEAAKMAHWDVEFAEATREADRLRLERATLTRAVRDAEGVLSTARSARRRAEEELARVDADRRERDRRRDEEAEDVRSLTDLDRRRERLAAEAEAARRETEGLGPVAAELADLRSARGKAELAVRGAREALDQQASSLRDLDRATAAWEAVQRQASESEARSRRAADDAERATGSDRELAQQSPLHEPPCPTDRTLTELDQDLVTARAEEHVAVVALARAKAALDQVLELLAAGVCPTCGQAVQAEGYAVHRQEASRAVDDAAAVLTSRSGERERLEDGRKARERYERAHERWVDLERRRREARESLAQRRVEAAAAKAAWARSAEDLTAARALVDRLRPAERQGAELRDALERAERTVRDVTAAEARAQAAAEKLRALSAIAESRAAEGARLEADLAALRRRREERKLRLSELERSLAGAEEASGALAKARSDEATLEAQLAEARDALVRADTRLDGLVERLAAAERGRAERAALVAEATELESRAEWVGEPFRLAVLRMEKELLAHAQATFDRAFARFFASLIDDPTLTARTDVSFTPEVTIAGEATPAEALSGGERTGLALAFRLALASVVRSLGTVRLQTLLLDEPTDGFSAEQVVRMGELLEELALPQVVLVSHESELGGVADRTVRVVKVDGRSALGVSGDASGTLGPSEPSARSPSLERASSVRARTR